MKFYRSCVLGIALLSAAPFVLPQSSPPPKADNTKQNQPGGPGDKPTADQQKQNQADLDLARQIRKAITDDKALSTYAHNTKVIVENGVVTLKGPVRSAAEKSSIESKAKAIAGEAKVHNELTIAPKSNS